LGEDPERDTSEAGSVSTASCEEATRSDGRGENKRYTETNERGKKKHEVLASLVFLCPLNVVRGGKTTVSRLATRYPKSKA